LANTQHAEEAAIKKSKRAKSVMTISVRSMGGIAYRAMNQYAQKTLKNAPTENIQSMSGFVPNALSRASRGGFSALIARKPANYAIETFLMS
jgi:uncharacterized membrane protein YebE (DUF533 family)